jgi:hypothetical protein
MRVLALASALAALAAPASAFFYGCYPASANNGALAYTNATSNTPSLCSTPCARAQKAVLILQGPDVRSRRGLRVRAR